MCERRSLWYVGLTLIASHCCARQAEGTCKPSLLDFPPWDGVTEAPVSSHPTAELGKQMGHVVCPAGLSLAHGGASWLEFLASSSLWTLQGGGNMGRVLAGAKNQWVHGLPWLSCMTFPAISLELECSREPAWGHWGLKPRRGQSLTYWSCNGMGVVQPNASGSAGEREQLPCISKGCSKRENFVPACH